MKKAKIVGASLATLLAVSYATGHYIVKPKLEAMIAPLAKQKLNTAINGTIQYDPIKVGWTGVYADNILIKNKHNDIVLEAKELHVGISPIGALKVALKKAEPLRALGTITIEKPRAYIAKSDEAKWNISNLLKQNKKSTTMSYRGDVVIKDGTISLKNEDNYQEIKSINGVVKLLDYPEFKGAITFDIDKEHITTTFKYNKLTKDWTTYIKTDKVELGKFAKFIPKNLAVNNLNGAIKNLSATISNKDGKLKIDGSAKLKDLNLEYKDYKLSEGEITVTGDGDILNIVKASAKVNEQLLSLSGDINLKNQEQNLNLYLVNAKVEKLIAKEGLTGVINANAKITGTVNDPAVKGEFKSNDINYNEYSVKNANAMFCYNNGIVNIDKVKIKSNIGELAGDGWYNTANKNYRVNLTTDNFQVNSIYKPIDMALSGDLKVQGVGSKVDKLEAKFNGRDFAYKGNYLGDLTGEIIGSNDNYLIKNLDLNTETGVMSAIGVYKNKDLDLEIKGNKVGLKPIAKFINLKGAGTVDFTARMTGALTNPYIKGQFVSDGGEVRRVKFDKATADFEFKDKRINIENGMILADKGSCLVTGSIGLNKDAPLDFELKANALRLENASKVIFKKLPATGNLYGIANIRGSIRHVDVTGDLSLKDGSVIDEIVTKANMKFTYKDKVLDVSDVKATVYDAEVVGSGKLIDENLDFQFAGDNMELARLIDIPDYEVEGKLAVKGRLGGNLDAMIVSGDVVANKIFVNKVALKDLKAQFYKDPDVIAIHNAEFMQGHGNYTYSGGVKLKTKALFGYAEAKNAPVAQMLKLAKLPVYNLDGNLSGSVDFGGTLNQPMVHVVGEVQDTTIKAEKMGVSDIDLQLEKGNFEIKKFKLPVGEGFIAALGKAKLGGDIDMQIAANKAPIKYIAALVGKDMPMEGLVEGVVNITGETKDPKMQVSTSVNNINYNGVEVDHVFMLGTLKGGVLDINQILAEHGQYKGKLYGKLPLASLYASENIPKSVDNKMDVYIDITEADLGVLPLFTSYITSGEGDVKGKVHLTGPIDDLTVDGAIDLKNGSVNIIDTKDPLQNINAAINFKGKDATVDISANMAEGKAELTGDMKWGLNAPFDYNLHLQTQDLVVNSKLFEGPLRADFTVKNDGDAPLIKGTWDISNDTLNIPLEFASTKTDFNPKLDVTVIAKEPVRLYNPILYDIPVWGEVNFKGTKAEPIGKGEFTTRMGTIKYLNNRFQIKEGKAEFGRMNTFLPKLEVKADTMVTDYIINMDLTGPVEKMNLKLTSQPELNEEQILSLLTVRSTNFDITQLQENAMNTIVSAGLQMVVLGSVENVVQSKLGIDRFAITNNYLDPYKLKENTSNNNINTAPFTYYSLELGKQIFPRFALTYGTGLNYSLNRFGFNYKLSSHMVTEAWFTNDDNYYYGLKYKLQF